MFRGSTFDIIAVALVALVLLFPRPGVRVLPALDRASAAELNRVGELEAKYIAAKDHTRQQLEVGLELGNMYMGLGHSDWALAVLRPLESTYPTEPRLYLAVAVAFADRFEFPAAKAALDHVRELCKQDKCNPGDEARSELLGNAIGEVVAQGASFAKDPNQVREILDRALHNTKVPNARSIEGMAPSLRPQRQASGRRTQPVRQCTTCHPKMIFSR